VLNDTLITNTITSTLLQPEGKKFWKKAFQDPAFAKAYAKSTQDENIQLMKSLLHDPEYRSSMIDILHDQEVEKNIIRLLKSSDFQKHLKTVFTKLLDTPEMKEKMIKAMESKS
jgi:spore germination protein D